MWLIITSVRTLKFFAFFSIIISGFATSQRENESSSSSHSSSLSSSSSSSSSLPLFTCPEQFGYFHDYSDCTKYFVCVFGEPLHETCTGGLHFSAELQTCDWPRNVRCERANHTDFPSKHRLGQANSESTFPENLKRKPDYQTNPKKNGDLKPHLEGSSILAKQVVNSEKPREIHHNAPANGQDSEYADDNNLDYNQDLVAVEELPPESVSSPTSADNQPAFAANQSFLSKEEPYDNLYRDRRRFKVLQDDNERGLYSSETPLHGLVSAASSTNGAEPYQGNHFLNGPSANNQANLAERAGRSERSETGEGRSGRGPSSAVASDQPINTQQVDRRRGVPHFQMQHFHQQQHFRRFPSTVAASVRSNDEANLPPSSPKRQGYVLTPYEGYSRAPQLFSHSNSKEQDQPRPVSRSRPRGRPPQRTHRVNPSFIEFTEPEGIVYEDEKVDSYESGGRDRPVRPSSVSLYSPPNREDTELPLPPPSLTRSEPDENYPRYPVISRVNSQTHFRPFVPPYAGFERNQMALSNQRYRPRVTSNTGRYDKYPVESHEPTPAPYEYGNPTPPDEGSRLVNLGPPSSRYTIVEPSATEAPLINRLPQNAQYNVRYDVTNYNHPSSRSQSFPATTPRRVVPKRPSTPPRLISRPVTLPVVTPSPTPVAPSFAPVASVSSQAHSRTRSEEQDSLSEITSALRNTGSGVPAEHGQPFGLVDYEDDPVRRPEVVTEAPHPPSTTLEVDVRFPPRTRYKANSPSPSPPASSGQNGSNRRSRPNKKRISGNGISPSHSEPASRPRNLYPTTEPFSNAVKCDPGHCRLPDCNCGSSSIPGGLKRSQVPQIVMITFDDAINDLNWEVYEEVFSNKRKNPNGCPLLGTFYVSHEWTDYGQVQTLYSRGHEMASHGVTHSFGEKFSKNQWHKEITGQREILNLYGGVRIEDVRGMRAPFLQIGGNKMFEVLYQDNFTYDSSMPVFDNKPPFWPYTLDYAINHECMIAPCPTESFPGIWEVGMVMMEDHRGGRCSMADACSNPSDENGVYNMLLKNFKRHYNSNRAPFGLYYHSAWFNTAHHRKGFMRFIDEILSYGDVYFVTKWQMIQWMRQPTPVSELPYFEPWDCNSVVANRPSPCKHPKVCNVQGQHGHQYMKTCQKCPKHYPWVGNTGMAKS